MKNHTEGPWIIEGNHILKRNDNGQLLRLDSIATVFPCAEGLVRDLPPETQANAHLISSAPELLEALEAMIEMYEDVQPSGGYQGVYEESVAAIAKAYGK